MTGEKADGQFLPKANTNTQLRVSDFQFCLHDNEVVLSYPMLSYLGMLFCVPQAPCMLFFRFGYINVAIVSRHANRL